MRTAIALRFRGNRHGEAPFVAAVLAPHTDLDRAVLQGCTGNERHPGDVLTRRASDGERQSVLDRVRHCGSVSVLTKAEKKG